MQKVRVIEERNSKKFTEEVNILLQYDYKILSASCGYTYKAILIKSFK
jgi:hypothetical protein